MSWSHLIATYDTLDSPQASGDCVAELLARYGTADVTITPARGQDGATDFIRILIPGARGKRIGGNQLKKCTTQSGPSHLAMVGVVRPVGAVAAGGK